MTAGGTDDRPAPEPIRTSARRRRPRRPAERAVLAVAVASVALVQLVLLARAARSGWGPTSDHAIQLLRAHDVTSWHTPLTGPYSRMGWDHPGPLSSWYLAPWLRLGGPALTLAGVGLLNLGWFAATLATARRLGGDLMLLAVTVVTSLWMSSATTTTVDPWNPFLATAPLLCFLVATAAFAETGTGWTLLLALVAGSFAAQAHLSAMAVVLVGSVGAAAWFVVSKPRVDRPRRLALTAGLVGTALWVGPLADLVAGERNLLRIARWSIGPSEGLPARRLLGHLATEFGPVPPWVGWGETSTDGLILVRPPLLLVVPLAALVAVGVMARRDPLARRLLGFAAWVQVCSIALGVRADGVPVPYQFRWTWPVSMFSAVALGAAILRNAGSSPPRSTVPPPVRFAATSLALVVSGLALGAALNDDPRPAPEHSDATVELVDQLRRNLPRGEYRSEIVHRDPFMPVPTGVLAALSRSGYEIDHPPGFAHKVGPRRAAFSAPERPTIVVVEGQPRPALPSGSRRVARWQPDEASALLPIEVWVVP